MSEKYDKSLAHMEKKLGQLGLSEKAARVYIDLLGREQVEVLDPAGLREVASVT